MSDSKTLLPVTTIIDQLEKEQISFGREGSDPYNTLRYYTKIGLLPHMTRKYSPHEGSVVGHYPEYVIDLVKKIESYKSQGLSNDEVRTIIDKINRSSNLRDRALDVFHSRSFYLTLVNVLLWVVVLGVLIQSSTPRTTNQNHLPDSPSSRLFENQTLMNSLLFGEITQEKFPKGVFVSRYQSQGSSGDVFKQEVVEKIDLSEIPLLDSGSSSEIEGATFSGALAALGIGADSQSNTASNINKSMIDVVSPTSQIESFGISVVPAGETEVRVSGVVVDEDATVFLVSSSQANVTKENSSLFVITLLDQQATDTEVRWFIRKG